jgi:hypothetical protein
MNDEFKCDECVKPIVEGEGMDGVCDDCFYQDDEGWLDQEFEDE